MNEGNSVSANTVQLNTPLPASGLVLEVIEGPMDGIQFIGEPQVVRLGRNLDNDLSLHADLYASGTHALLRRGGQGWMLEDQGSSNGTFVEGGQLGAPHPLPMGQLFVIGHVTVIHCRHPRGEENRSITPETLHKGKSRLYEQFSPAMRQAFGAATMLACQERRGFINDRHLFLGLAMNNADLPIFERGKGPVPHEFLDHVLRIPSAWNSSDDWVHQHLQARQFNNFFAIELPWTPRVIWSLMAAGEVAEKRGSQVIEPLDWFRAVLSDPMCQTHRALAHHELDPEALYHRLAGIPVDAQAAKTVRSSGGFFGPNWATVKGAEMTVSSGDVDVDHRAQGLARQLDGLAAMYFLATPEDRRVAMKDLLGQELRRLDNPEIRRPLLEQLQRLFPLDAGSPELRREMQRLNNRIQQLEHRIQELEAQQGPSTSGMPWHLIIENRPSSELDALSPVERPRLEFLREVYGFSVKLERFIVNLVQGFNSSSMTTMSVSLPGHRLSIKAYVDDMNAGRQVRQEDLQLYLQDIETWLVASIAAYSEGPRVWFEDFWRKASPVTIERNLDQDWKKNLGLQHREFWQQYRDATRGLSPDLVAQKIFHEVKRITKERRQSLSQRRTQS